MQHRQMFSGVCLCRSKRLPCTTTACSCFDDRGGRWHPDLAKLVYGIRLMISLPRILARFALGSWAICALLPLGPIAAALAGSGGSKPPSFVATEEQRAAVQRLLERDDLTTLEGQAVDVNALRRLYQLRGYDLLWATRDDRVALLAAAYDDA